MAIRKVMVSDMSGAEIPDKTGAQITIKFNDARRGIRVLDVTDDEAEKFGGRQAKRRGRMPKSAAAAA